MRSLFITRRFLEDGEAPVTGSYQRMGMFLEALGRISDRVEILAMAPHDFVPTPDAEARNRARYEAVAGRDVTLTIVRREAPQRPASALTVLHRGWDLAAPGVGPHHATAGPAQIEAVRAAVARNPDVVFVHRLTAMAPLLRGRITHPNILFDLDDIEHRAHIRHTLSPPRWPSKYLQLVQTLPLIRAERAAVARARRTYVCSAQDRDDLKRMTHADGIEAIPNAVPMPPLSELPGTPTLLFLGSPIFAPNLHGANWLIDRVMPRIRAAIPEARLIVAGQHADRIPSFASPPPGVEFRGFVADLAALYRDVRVVTCPILSGSGTRVKIVEGAAHRRAIVATTIGAEGLPLVDGQSILLRDTPEDFAAGCIALLRNDALASRLAAAARNVAETHFDRASIVAALAASMRE